MNITDVDWGDVSEATINKRTQQLTQIAKWSNTEDISIIPNIMHQENFPEWLEIQFDENAFSENTRRSYLTTTIVYGEKYNLDPKVQTALLVAHGELDSFSSEVHAVPKEQYTEHLRRGMINRKTPQTIKIMIGLIQNGLGPLRMNDLIHTRLQDDKEYHYLDLDNCHWYIRAQYTKNKRDRDFSVPQSVCQKLRSQLNSPTQTWLLQNKRGHKYTDTASLSQSFTKYCGINYRVVRKSVVTETNRHATLEETKKLAEILGHQLRTNLVNYSRDLVDPNNVK